MNPVAVWSGGNCPAKRRLISAADAADAIATMIIITASTSANFLVLFMMYALLSSFGALSTALLPADIFYYLYIDSLNIDN